MDEWHFKCNWFIQLSRENVKCRNSSTSFSIMVQKIITKELLLFYSISKPRYSTIMLNCAPPWTTTNKSCIHFRGCWVTYTFDTVTIHCITFGGSASTKKNDVVCHVNMYGVWVWLCVCAHTSKHSNTWCRTSRAEERIYICVWHWPLALAWHANSLCLCNSIPKWLGALLCVCLLSEKNTERTSIWCGRQIYV